MWNYSFLPANTQGEPLGCEPCMAVISLWGICVVGNGSQVCDDAAIQVVLEYTKNSPLPFNMQ